ncbi:MAG TPA: hypothetical protein VEH84_11250 [Alphaproteobacteria bacterium]|nr:hypothetical protein [Alphaproteobacteria bacterium]
MDGEDRLEALEKALSEIAQEAEAARFALCAHELSMRLENIARIAQAARRPPPPEG